MSPQITPLWGAVLARAVRVHANFAEYEPRCSCYSAFEPATGTRLTAELI